MNQRDENFVTMCRAVQAVLTAQTAVWETNNAFKNLVLKYDELLDDVANATVNSEIVSTGATTDKANAERAAIKMTVNLAKRASVYALEEGNVELHDQLRVTKSTLERRPDTMTLAKMRDIHNRLTAVVADLADYGVLPADLTAMDGLINAYEAIIVRPRTLIVERKGYNQNTIPELLAEVRVVLYKMDSMINLYEGEALKQQYKDARIIIDLGGGSDVPVEPNN